MLDKLNKDNPFNVPENYFDNFHKEMMSKISTEKQAKKIPLWKKPVAWGAVAAILCGIVFSLNILSKKPDLQLANTNDKTHTTDMYASSDEEYFMLFLEDEVTQDMYNDTFLY